jgi:hypothetical protein
MNGSERKASGEERIRGWLIDLVCVIDAVIVNLEEKRLRRIALILPDYRRRRSSCFAGYGYGEVSDDHKLLSSAR